ncbi:hypothetical protein [Gemmata massiliana]|uniref:hypothetical protein n=1 Tax=Gemmata massiliana TaxID=1210884 RepID=UPI0013A6AB03|nr:hypothetical protein [Gemmata massiliana]
MSRAAAAVPRRRRKVKLPHAPGAGELLKAFALRATAHHAVRSIPCHYATARGAYRRFRTALAQIAAEERRQLLGELELD